MPTTAAGPISLAVDALRTTFAGSATFRTWVGAANQAEALARCHRYALPPPELGRTEHRLSELQLARPYAAVWVPPDDGSFALDHDAAGSGFDFRHHGVLAARMVWDVPRAIENDLAEIFTQFNNTLGQILVEMGDLAGDGAGGYLAFESARTIEGPARIHPKLKPRIGDIVEADLEFTWRGGP